MKIGVLKEILPHETRVALIPETTKRLKAQGCEVFVQSKAGETASISDEAYKEAGASVIADARQVYSEADVIFKVQYPDSSSQQNEVEFLKSGSILIALLQPLVKHDLIQKLAQKQVTAFSMDMIPRIARAQKLDSLSSQSNVAGYKAVLLAANATGKMLPMLMTAAGTVTPAKVFVIGAGVAGLQAIATAKRLGALVEAYDTRPVVKEQVESLGGKFLSLELAGEEAEDKRGYAKELSEEAKKKTAQLMAEAIASSDIVITTALIPGKPAPKLITEAMVRSMKQGSVIVDLAADGGGNCELSEPGATTVKHGVTLIAKHNVPGLMASQSSQLYARNVFNFFTEIYKKGSLQIDLENEVVKGALITREGQVVHEMVQKVLG